MPKPSPCQAVGPDKTLSMTQNRAQHVTMSFAGLGVFDPRNITGGGGGPLYLAPGQMWWGWVMIGTSSMVWAQVIMNLLLFT